MIATHADMVYLDATHARCRHCGTIVCAFATFEMQPLAQRHRPKPMERTHRERAADRSRLPRPAQTRHLCGRAVSVPVPHERRHRRPADHRRRHCGPPPADPVQCHPPGLRLAGRSNGHSRVTWPCALRAEVGTLIDDPSNRLLPPHQETP